MNQQRFRLTLPLCLGFLFVTAIGCSSDPGGELTTELAPVKGKVTYKGKPVPGGMVVFRTEDGTSRGVAPIGRDGSYSMKSPIGKVTVAVVTRPVSTEDTNSKNRPAVREVAMPTGVRQSSLPPRKYESFETSGLSYEVSASGGTINVTLN